MDECTSGHLGNLWVISLFLELSACEPVRSTLSPSVSPLSQFHRSVLSARQWNKLRKYHGHKSHLVLQSIFILPQQCLMYHCIYLCPRAMKWRSDATEAALKRKMCDIPYSASGGFDTNPWLGQLWEFSWANWPRNWHQKLSRISRLIWASPASLWL